MAETFLAELVFKGSIEFVKRKFQSKGRVLVRLPKFFQNPPLFDSFPDNPIADENGLEVFVENYSDTNIIISSFQFQTSLRRRIHVPLLGLVRIEKDAVVTEYSPNFLLEERCPLGPNNFAHFKLRWNAVETCAQQARELRTGKYKESRDTCFELATYDEYAHQYFCSSANREFAVRSAASQALGKF